MSLYLTAFSTWVVGGFLTEIIPLWTFCLILIIVWHAKATVSFKNDGDKVSTFLFLNSTSPFELLLTGLTKPAYWVDFLAVVSSNSEGAPEIKIKMLISRPEILVHLFSEFYLEWFIFHIPQFSKRGTKVVFQKWVFDTYQL